MIPKVGQLLRWYDNVVLNPDGHDNDLGIVKEVRIFTEFKSEYNYAVIIDWCRGPHSSYHDCDEYEESIGSGEIVVVE
mgnify:CR=1 FL=1